jgi:hypothetical protein
MFFESLNVHSFAYLGLITLLFLGDCIICIFWEYFTFLNLKIINIIMLRFVSKICLKTCHLKIFSKVIIVFST